MRHSSFLLNADASASIGQQAFGSGGVFMSQASTMLQQPLALPEDDEAASPRDGGTVNNRVAGGAGKRLCVEDLQVCLPA